MATPICEAQAILPYTADNVEWDLNLNLLAISTYQLQQHETTPTRLGSLHFFRIQSTEDRVSWSQVRDHTLSSGVFDFKWRHDSTHQKGYIAAGLANGDITLHCVSQSEDNVQVEDLQVLSFKELGDENDMVLGVDWAKLNSSTESKLISSYQKGGIALWDICCERATPLWYSPNAHDSDVWQSCFIEEGNPHLFMSCSDDCTLKIWDTRLASSGDTEYEGRCVKILNQHGGGVTSMVSTELSGDLVLKRELPHALLIGSYDDTLSIFDIRMMKDQMSVYTLSGTKPQNARVSKNTTTPAIHEFSTGGGVWRIKCRPNESSERSFIAMSCIYNGFQVWSITAKDGVVSESEKVCHYSGPHGEKDLAYGIDWVNIDSKHNLLASCSFYDKTCSIWSY